MPQRTDLSQNVLGGNGFHMEVLGTIAPSSYPALTCGLSTDPFSPLLDSENWNHFNHNAFSGTENTLAAYQ